MCYITHVRFSCGDDSTQTHLCSLAHNDLFPWACEKFDVNTNSTSEPCPHHKSRGFHEKGHKGANNRTAVAANPQSGTQRKPVPFHVVQGRHLSTHQIHAQGNGNVPSGREGAINVCGTAKHEHDSRLCHSRLGHLNGPVRAEK